jgi:hypothetical protein
MEIKLYDLNNKIMEIRWHKLLRDQSVISKNKKEKKSTHTKQKTIQLTYCWKWR